MSFFFFHRLYFVFFLCYKLSYIKLMAMSFIFCSLHFEYGKTENK